MKKRLSQQEKDLKRITDEILYYIWDPLGISPSPQARDEYSSCALGAFARLVDDCNEHQVIEYLSRMQVELYEINPNKEKDLEVSRLLLGAKSWIFECTSD